MRIMPYVVVREHSISASHNLARMNDSRIFRHLPCDDHRLLDHHPDASSSDAYRWRTYRFIHFHFTFVNFIRMGKK